MLRKRTISKIVPFERTPDGEYQAVRDGLSFTIARAANVGWGLSVFDRNTREYVAPIRGGAFSWLRTQKKCVERAEQIWQQRFG